jgi:hypothetical protein
MSEEMPTRVDFGYSFATPHRLTVARPNSSDKTLLDLQPGSLRMAWTYEDLNAFPIFAFATPTTRWDMRLTPQIDGKPFARSEWTRAEGYLPVLDNTYADGRGTMRLEVAGGAEAAIVRITATNTADRPHTFKLVCEKPGAWAGMNPAWVDPDVPADVMQAGWLDRADRVLVLACGADCYPLPGATFVCMEWTIPPGETRTGWLVRPYRAYGPDVERLRAQDWSAAYEQALAEWRALLAQAAPVSIPDAGVRNGYYACLADLFIMREPLADGHIVGVPGTEGYRAPNSYEAGIMAVALDQVGLHDEAARGYELPLSLQEPNGDWTEPKGWAHTMWGGAGFKSWVAMEHYRLTGDREYLAQVYPRMAASSRWQDGMREKTRNPVTRNPVFEGGGAQRPDRNRVSVVPGLMPRGMGDCGLKDGDDLYGVFIPHNIWTVYADKMAVEAARILGCAGDLPELERIYQTALADLLKAMDAGAIQADGYRWIPGVPGKTSGSRWGVLNALFPCGLLAPDHELIEGTLRHIESQLSPGGIPINTGWMADGMWVAITLDNIAAAHMARGNGDAAAEYLYAVLNHGTPLYTWCEERGQEPYTEKTSGDRQHLWTPVAVVRALRDCLVFERAPGELHLALGMPRSWLASGQPVGIANAATHFGPVSYRMQFDSASRKLTGRIEFSQDSTTARAVLHVRLPGNAQIKAAGGGATITADGGALQWDQPRGVIQIEATL